jgi:DUF4097 and DUF4098 domain-containing protein YvlB
MEYAMRRLPAFALMLPFALVPLLASASNYDKINGSVHVDAGQHAGDIRTVNGSVGIDANAIVQDARTVNGSVELGEKAQADDIRTANGSIRLGPQSRVNGTVKTANGRILLDKNASVAGHVSNVNGHIELIDAYVGNGLETTNGGIDVGAGSRIKGGILFNRPNGNYTDDRLPHVVIGPHAIVEGTLEFQRPVVLDVSDSAQIGPVKGATPVKFSGNEPPTD